MRVRVEDEDCEGEDCEGEDCESELYILCTKNILLYMIVWFTDAGE